MGENDLLAEYLAVAVEAAQIAGEVIRKGFYQTKNVEHKGLVDLVTETDKACEELIFNHLKQKYPEHKFIGEETSAEFGTAELTDNPTWMVDPLDGTTNFVHGFPFVCVSIGLTIGKVPTIGVVFNPIINEAGCFAWRVAYLSYPQHFLKVVRGDANSKHTISGNFLLLQAIERFPSLWSQGLLTGVELEFPLSLIEISVPTIIELSCRMWKSEKFNRNILSFLFTGIRGRGAFLNGAPIKASSQSELVKSLLATEVGTKRDKSTVDATTDRINSLLFKVRSLRMTGSCALNLCGIACGRLDLFYELGFGGPWDVAGGAVIVEEAGGLVFDPSGGDFDVMSRRVAATNCYLKELFVAALREAE